MEPDRTISGRVAAIKRVRSQDYREAYSNLCQGRLGAFDITLIFSQTKESLEHGVVNEEVAAITMAPAQFKLLARLCNSLTDAYEQAVAPIHIPEGSGNPNLEPKLIAQSIKAAQEDAQQADLENAPALQAVPFPATKSAVVPSAGRRKLLRPHKKTKG